MLEFAAQIIVIFSAVVAGFWAYTKYIVERGILPPTEFSISLNPIGIQNELILEISLHLKNLGNSALIVQSLWVDVRYLRQGDAVGFIKDPEERHRCGLTDFPRSVKKRLSTTSLIEARKESLSLWLNCREKRNEDLERQPRGLPVLPYKTFVQAGVEQKYTYITNVEKDTSFVLINAEFYYQPRPSFFQRIILSLSKPLGLINYSLSHVDKPHTCQKVFEVNLPNEINDIEGHLNNP